MYSRSGHARDLCLALGGVEGRCRRAMRLAARVAGVALTAADVRADCFELVPARSGSDERGQPGLAFHPDFAITGAAGEGKFYVNDSAPHPNAPGPPSAPFHHIGPAAEFSA